jgi:hypothetical protein
MKEEDMRADEERIGEMGTAVQVPLTDSHGGKMMSVTFEVLHTDCAAAIEATISGPLQDDWIQHDRLLMYD